MSRPPVKKRPETSKSSVVMPDAIVPLPILPPTSPSFPLSWREIDHMTRLYFSPYSIRAQTETFLTAPHHGPLRFSFCAPRTRLLGSEKPDAGMAELTVEHQTPQRRKKTLTRPKDSRRDKASQKKPASKPHAADVVPIASKIWISQIDYDPVRHPRLLRALHTVDATKLRPTRTATSPNLMLTEDNRIIRRRQFKHYGVTARPRPLISRCVTWLRDRLPTAGFWSRLIRISPENNITLLNCWTLNPTLDWVDKSGNRLYAAHVERLSSGIIAHIRKKTLLDQWTRPYTGTFKKFLRTRIQHHIQAFESRGYTLLTRAETASIVRRQTLKVIATRSPGSAGLPLRASEQGSAMTNPATNPFIRLSERFHQDRKQQQHVAIS